MKHKGLFDSQIFLKPLDWPKLKKRTNKQIERKEKWIAGLNEKRELQKF
ncbi:MAG: hypothetical protein WCF23_15150 [Candidatus Nitrosopolaris sp.]